MTEVFTDVGKRDKHLTQENGRLPKMIGGLTIELKKPKSG
jgi:hypothetical protein